MRLAVAALLACSVASVALGQADQFAVSPATCREQLYFNLSECGRQFPAPPQSNQPLLQACLDAAREEHRWCLDRVPKSDLNLDGQVDESDLLLMMERYGEGLVGTDELLEWIDLWSAGK